MVREDNTHEQEKREDSDPIRSDPRGMGGRLFIRDLLGTILRGGYDPGNGILDMSHRTWQAGALQPISIPSAAAGRHSNS